MVGPQSEPAAVLYSTNPDTAAEQVNSPDVPGLPVVLMNRLPGSVSDPTATLPFGASVDSRTFSDCAGTVAVEHEMS